MAKAKTRRRVRGYMERKNPGILLNTSKLLKKLEKLQQEILITLLVGGVEVTMRELSGDFSKTIHQTVI